MSVRMKLKFSSPAADEHDRTFVASPSTTSSRRESDDSFEERKQAFMQDEELMRQASDFVSELIETATAEAAKRAEQEAKTGANDEGQKFRGSQTLAGWNNRARGFCNRVWNAVLPCFQNNEILAWAQPLRHRFTRP
ncbi:uncharacterized protein LOC131670635 [Phymastichus coffea]|uniref:uncharacterized protein LOC131670635 n=1 Tax=Phymastichus coffea TaxID=108790 RepID=UPI00273B373D|nr:uncharacterized protein LOC131670635 [Phymastichus coffea]